MRRLLAELTRTHLITEHAPGRYVFHDLLHTYAADLAQRIEPDDQRHAATHRMLDHYLHTAYAAALLLDPLRDPITLSPPQPGVIPESLVDQQQGMAWFTTEHSVLLTAIDHATNTGLHTHTWQLAWTVTDYLDRQGRWHDQAITGQAAVAAATARRTPPCKLSPSDSSPAPTPGKATSATPILTCRMPLSCTAGRATRWGSRSPPHPWPGVGAAGSSR